MKISVIINNFNYASFLSDAVMSAYRQEFSPCEIIVVDDGSTDHSIDIVRNLQDVVPNLVVNSQPNSGQLAAIRSGIESSTGEWCAFLDADDTWEYNHLSGLVKALAEDDEVGAYYSGHKETDGQKRFRSEWPEGAVGPVSALVALTGIRMGTITSALMLRRDFAHAVAMLPKDYDMEWKTRADDCLIFGASLSGAIVYHNEQATVNYRIHSSNQFVSNGLTAYENYLYNLRKNAIIGFYKNRYNMNEQILSKLLSIEFKRHFRNQTNAFSTRIFLSAIMRSDISILKKIRIYSRATLKSKSLFNNFHDVENAQQF